MYIGKSKKNHPPARCLRHQRSLGSMDREPFQFPVSCSRNVLPHCAYTAKMFVPGKSFCTGQTRISYSFPVSCLLLQGLLAPLHYGGRECGVRGRSRRIRRSVCMCTYTVRLIRHTCVYTYACMHTSGLCLYTKTAN